MKSATRRTVSAFGTLAAIAGIEHGTGEILQGNTAPGGILILSWPDTPFFQVMVGEPAMTVVPNLLVTGILAVLVSLVLLVWVWRFVHRKHGGLGLILISLLLLLVGGGFGPPLLGLILGVAATGIRSPLTWWRSHLPYGLRSFLGKLWRVSLLAGLLGWLFLFPGVNLLDTYANLSNMELTILVTIIYAFGFLLLTIFLGLAYDSVRRDIV
jgi:hypothetical protein